MPLQKLWFPGAVTSTAGLTVMVKLSGVPLQPFADGVTVTVVVTATVDVFVAVNEPILPEPVVASPVLLSVFTQV